MYEGVFCQVGALWVTSSQGDEVGLSAGQPDRFVLLNTGDYLRGDLFKRSKQLIVVRFGVETPGGDMQPVRVAESRRDAYPPAFCSDNSVGGDTAGCPAVSRGIRRRSRMH